MIKLLNDGFIRLVDVMGTDHDIAEAARVSYGKGTKSISKDNTLIRYLLRHGHTSPFEMVELKFHIRIPMDAWRQMIRHRTANVNEYSTRYSEAIDSNYITTPDGWRMQSTNNKQGSGEFFDPTVGCVFTKSEEELLALSWKTYSNMIEQGVAREQARKNLPLSTYTEAYWKIDLHNLLHFLKLRLDSHAQLEIRTYAKAIAEIVKEKFPLSWQAFEDYEVNSIKITGLEVEAIQKIMSGMTLEQATQHITNEREKEECILKVTKMTIRKL